MTLRVSTKSVFNLNGTWGPLLLAAIAGCATPPPATQAVTPLSFDYKPGPKAKDTGHAIAFVNAKASTTDPSGSGVAVRVQSGNAGAWAPRSPQLEAALSQTIAQIVSNRGFRTMGPFSSDDDLTFVDKKAAYLASTPELIYAVERADQVKRCGETNCNETGNFVVTGKLVLRLVEPMTKQSLLNKTINLSDFGISHPYTMNYAAPVQTQQAKPSSLLAALMAGAPAKPDNWRDPYNKAVNEFFAKAVVKIESHFDREEIVRLEPTVLELKGLKRF
jgi:Neuraminyllactose-binding hemagglutinin precursor (NLBH)